jgi:hypothetical protein
MLATALFVLIVTLTGEPVKVSVNVETDMNTCHDTRATLDRIVKDYNAREETRKITHYTAVCVDLSSFLRRLQEAPIQYQSSRGQ